QSYGVIDRYPHISCKIQRSPQAHNGNAHKQHNKAEEKSAVGKQYGEEPGKKFCDISQEKHIDNGPQTDLFPVHEQCKDKKKKTEYRIEGSIAYGGQIPKSVCQNLKGIHTKGGIVEKSHGHTAGGNSGHCHHHTS